jgi:hypothetical protein
MEKQLRYQGEFFSVAGVLWRVEQDADVPYPAVAELRFPAETPLVFEWAETDKLEPVQGSAVTLEIVSKVNRQYKDLYTVEAGSIRMDAYRDDVLYWSGTLDTEAYEEPFSYENEYEVKLTFSDFSLLDRMNFSLRGTRSISVLIDNFIAETKINNRGIERYISTTCSSVSGEMLDNVGISCENFYDEEGVPLTMREVLDEILRPFALRLIQREGKLFIYDLNAVQAEFKPEQIHWESDDAVLGVDKTYKNVTLTFSPYPQKKLYSTTLTEKMLDEGAERYYVAKDLSKSPFVDNNIGFMIDLKKTTGVSEELEIRSDKALLFRIIPVFSGSEAFGIASRIRDVYKMPLFGTETPIDTSGSDYGAPWLFKVRRTLSLPETRVVFNYSSPGVILDGKSCLTDIMLRLKVEAMIDGRYNPFEEATALNGKSAYEKMQDIKEYNISYILRIIDTDGNIKMHYENRVYDKESEEEGFFRHYKEINGKWVDGDVEYGTPKMTSLRYYDSGGYTGWRGGWQMNRVGYLRSYIPRTASGEGDLIPIPPGNQGCTLELTIISCFARVVNPHKHNGLTTDSHTIPRWVLFKIPELTLVNQYGKEVVGNDIEYKTWLNSSAKEEKKIETIVGTPCTSTNFGMGMLLDVSSRTTLQIFTRAGVSASLEKLLIGTWYSNYNRRMNMLSGTVRLLNRFGTYTDVSEPGTYLMVGDVQDVREDESNVKLAEITPDNFEGIEYE